MGYGGKAMLLLQQYFEGKFPSLAENPGGDAEDDLDDATTKASTNGDDADADSKLLKEKIAPRKKLPPLLLKLNERRPERLDYLGVAYGLTESLLKVIFILFEYSYHYISFLFLSCISYISERP